MATYVDQLAKTEQRVAQKYLSTPTVAAADFEQVTETFAFQAAVLVNERGELLNVYPHRAELVGQPIARRYPHLRAAVAGRVGVSDVTPSAAEASPVVAVAVPFDTPHGQRVYSGAYTVTQTPLAAFLETSHRSARSRSTSSTATGPSRRRPDGHRETSYPSRPMLQSCLA